MTDTHRRIGFVGLGNMGLPIARHLHEAGHPVTGFDPTPAARGRASEAGIDLVDRIEQLPARSDVIILMLPNSDVVESVLLGGLLDDLPAGSLVVDMGSSRPASTRDLAERAKGHGVGFVDAPVSGGVAGAEAGTLTVMVGGADADVTPALQLLSPVAGKIAHVGPAGAGHALKALNNLMSATHLLVSSEALLVGQKFGLDVNVMLDTINTSTGRSGSTEVKWPRYIVPGTYDSGFALALMLKDMRIATDLAQECGLPARLGEAAVQLWTQAAAELEPGADHTEIAGWLANT